MAEKSINCIKALVRLCPIQTPWSRDPETLFRLKIVKKTKRFMIFDPKKGESFFRHPPPPPRPPSLKTSKKWVSSGEGGLGGSRPKTHWGVHLLDKIMILQGVKQTIQPLRVGYANRPKKAQNGGVCGVFPYIRLPGFDLTTFAS